MSRSANLENERQHRLRVKNTVEGKRGTCAGGIHAGDKHTEGNRVICGNCGRLVGFVRDPRKWK